MKKLILLIIIVASANASERMYGIYSSLEVNPESGDIGGMEVLILHNGRPGTCSDSALVQVAEGWVQMPALVDCCHCSNERVEFSVPKLGTFKGAIVNGVLEGEFIDSGWEHSLPKGNSFWQ
ncbi:hypothetical protein [Reinekea sp.]|jgi:hypothetical protein|uniref:hypothetical protein n=1 Tax=Reinekea sp. TaxID=1970455 RepID=UPI00398A1094